MPNRIRVALIASLTLISSLMAAAPAGAAVTPQKVVIIVGPTGALTDNYRSKGDSIALAAEAAGATVLDSGRERQGDEKQIRAGARVIDRRKQGGAISASLRIER